MLPAKCPPGAVIVAGGVANAVVSNTLAIVGRQQVAPVLVAVGVGMGCRTLHRGEMLPDYEERVGC